MPTRTPPALTLRDVASSKRGRLEYRKLEGQPLEGIVYVEQELDGHEQDDEPVGMTKAEIDAAIVSSGITAAQYWAATLAVQTAAIAKISDP